MFGGGAVEGTGAYIGRQRELKQAIFRYLKLHSRQCLQAPLFVDRSTERVDPDGPMDPPSVVNSCGEP